MRVAEELKRTMSKNFEVVRGKREKKLIKIHKKEKRKKREVKENIDRNVGKF